MPNTKSHFLVLKFPIRFLDETDTNVAPLPYKLSAPKPSDRQGYVQDVANFQLTYI
jgi:hypothetical protein